MFCLRKKPKPKQKQIKPIEERVQRKKNWKIKKFEGDNNSI